MHIATVIGPILGIKISVLVVISFEKLLTLEKLMQIVPLLISSDLIGAKSLFGTPVMTICDWCNASERVMVV